MATNHTEDIPAETLVEKPTEKVDNPTEIVKENEVEKPADRVGDPPENSHPDIPEYLKLSGEIVYSLIANIELQYLGYFL